MDLQVYAGLVRRTAKRLCPTAGTLDECRNDRDDYEQLLWERVWRAWQRFDELPRHKQIDRDAYVTTTVRNAERNILRDRARTHETIEYDDEAFEADSDLEEQTNNRNTVVRIVSVCTPLELQWLLRIIANGGNVAGAYDPKEGNSLSWFRMQLGRLRAYLLRAIGEGTTMREALIAEAVRLGVTYTNDMSEDELRRRIDAASTNRDVPEKPACFGVFWDAVGDDNCQVCQVQRSCSMQFSKTINTLIKGGAVTVSALTTATGVGSDAVRLAVQKAGHAISEDGSIAVPETPDVQDQPSGDVEAAPAKKKGGRKKRPPKKKVAAVEVPTVAGSAQAVSEPAQPPIPPTDSAPRVGAPAVDGMSEAGRQQAFARERRRSPLIAGLTPGVSLTRHFKGEEHRVQVEAGHYLYRGQKFPTLYAVTVAITGSREYPGQLITPKSQDKDSIERYNPRKMSAWSSTRFWRLRENAISKTGVQKALALVRPELSS